MSLSLTSQVKADEVADSPLLLARFDQAFDQKLICILIVRGVTSKLVCRQPFLHGKHAPHSSHHLLLRNDILTLHHR